MKYFKFFFTSIFLACLFLASLQTAFAHATPLSYEPDASSVLQSNPAEVKIHFSENIEPKASSITVYAPDGSRADNNDASVDSKDTRLFSVSLKNSGEARLPSPDGSANGGQGSYTVSWQVVSADDGHFTQGAYVFSVGQTSANINAPAQSGFQIQHSSSIPEGATIGLELVGEALLLGLLVVIAFLWRPMRRKYFIDELKTSDGIIIKRLNLSLLFGFILILAGGISYLIFKTNELAGLQNSAFSATFWVFCSTLSARYTIYRLCVIVVFFLLFWFVHKRILESDKITKIEIVLFLLLGFTAFARARVSHAAASTFYPSFSILVNFIHLYFKDLWIGGVLALLVLFSPIVKKLQNLKLTGFVLTQFSKITALSFGIGGVTGVYIIWLHLKSFSNIFITDWGSKFILLSVFAGFLVFARIFHQLLLEPKVSLGKDSARLLSWLPITLPFEAVMGIFILLSTAVLIITTPPIAPHYNFLRQADSQGVNISLTQDPYETNKLLVTLEDAKNHQPSEIQNLIISLTNREKNIGPITATTEKRFVGGYVLDESQLTPAGNWQMDVTAQRDGTFDAVASFSLNFPNEINFAKAHSEDRSFDSFAMLCVLMGVIIVFTAILLYCHSSKLNKHLLDSPLPLTSNFSPLLYGRGVWTIGFIIGLFILMFFGGSHGMGLVFLQSNFQKECEKNSSVTLFAWHESVPERAGQATSDIAVPGCMVGVGLGQYHFANEKEFVYFTRTPDALAEMHLSSKKIEAGKPETLIFKIKDYSNKPVTEITPDHDRIMHVVIVPADFSSYAHIHVEDNGPVTSEMLKNAEFPVKYTFEKSGKYLVSVDFSVRAKPFSEQFYVDVAGNMPQAPQIEDFSSTKNFYGYDVSLKTSRQIKPGQLTTLNYHIEKNGKEVKDLQAYLSVPMHISVISSDLIKFIHIHGLLPPSWLDQLTGASIHAQHLFLPNKFGPDITTSLIFPASGVYHIFGEFKHNGKVIPTDFMIRAE